MEYYFSKTLNVSYDEAVKLTTEALKSEGFGVISEINMHEKLKEKVGVDFKRYKILGACNPSYAYKALQAEDKIGTMMPCNVLVIEQGPVSYTHLRAHETRHDIVCRLLLEKKKKKKTKTSTTSNKMTTTKIAMNNK